MSSFATFDILITVAAIVIGILLLLGKGDIFMGGKSAADRNKEYDDKKVQKGFGVTLIIVGIATGISALFQTTASYIIYIVVVILAFGGGVYYMRKYCKK